MPRIVDELTLCCPKEVAFQEIATVGFMRAIDSNFGQATRILLENRRLIRSVSTVEGVGDVEVERLLLPEAGIIVTQRRPPMGPFVYQLSIQQLMEHEQGAVLKWTDEFELDAESKPREAVVVDIIRRNDRANLLKTQSRIAELHSRPGEGIAPGIAPQG